MPLKYFNFLIFVISFIIICFFVNSSNFLIYSQPSLSSIDSYEHDLFSSTNNVATSEEEKRDKEIEKELEKILLSNQPFTSSTIINENEVDITKTNNNTNQPSSLVINENNENNEILSMSILENKTKESDYFSIVTAGDFGCSMRAQENIKEMSSLDPDLFLALGDYSYKKSPDCWFEMTKSLDANTKIAIGNHEDKEESEGSDKLIQSYLDHYDLDNTYYSFDYKNLHVLVLNTQKELSIDLLEGNAIAKDDEDYDEYIEEIKENGNTHDLIENLNNDDIPDFIPEITLKDLVKKHSINANISELNRKLSNNSLVPDIEIDPNQYVFAINDLKKAAKDPSIDWIFVMFHKPMYATPSKQSEEFIIREKYQPMFDEYGVDLVLQAHGHFYDRTLPLKYNPENIHIPIIDKTTENNNNNFVNPDGTIFTVVGTGGKGPHRLVDTPEYTASQHLPIAGFLSIEIAGKHLEATYYDIGIKCEESISEKTGKTIFNLDICEQRDESEPLKLLDKYSITKDSSG